jgi:nucleoid DNA-binding protein
MRKPQKPHRHTALIEHMHNLCPDYHKYEYKEFIQIFTQAVEDMVTEDKEVPLESFGIFSLKKVKAFRTYDPKTDKYVDYPESAVLKFKPSITLQKRVKLNTKSIRNLNENKETPV